MKFPASFQSIWNNKSIVGAWVGVSENKYKLKGTCDNCDGAGFIYTFVAYSGPFRDRPPETHEVLHYINNAWWIGESYTDICPVCKGMIKEGERAMVLKDIVKQQILVLEDKLKTNTGIED